jgi:hypothetical protein
VLAILSRLALCICPATANWVATVVADAIAVSILEGMLAETSLIGRLLLGLGLILTLCLGPCVGRPEENCESDDQDECFSHGNYLLYFS